MARRYVIALTSTERQTLETFVAQGKRVGVDLQSAQVLLKADLNHREGGWTDPAISQALGLDIAFIAAVRQRFAVGRLVSALKQPCSTSVPSQATRSSPTLNHVRIPLQGILASRMLPGLVLGCLGLTNLGAFAWLTMVPPTPTCQGPPSLLRTDGERLYCMNQAILSGNLEVLKTGLDLAKSWDPDSPLFPQVQALGNEWSAFSLVVARQKTKKGDLQAAIALLQKVPTTSPYAADAQALIQEWQNTWREGKQRVEMARTQLQQRNRTEALLQVKALAALNHDYWQTQADQLMNQIVPKNHRR